MLWKKVAFRLRVSWFCLNIALCPFYLTWGKTSRYCSTFPSTLASDVRVYKQVKSVLLLWKQLLKSCQLLTLRSMPFLLSLYFPSEHTSKYTPTQMQICTINTNWRSMAHNETEWRSKTELHCLDKPMSHRDKIQKQKTPANNKMQQGFLKASINFLTKNRIIVLHVCHLWLRSINIFASKLTWSVITLKMKMTNERWFFSATQFIINRQWWSRPTTTRSHNRQNLVLSGLIT